MLKWAFGMGGLTFTLAAAVALGLAPKAWGGCELACSPPRPNCNPCGNSSGGSSHVDVNGLRQSGQGLVGGANARNQSSISNYQQGKYSNTVLGSAEPQFPSVRDQVLKQDLKRTNCRKAQRAFQNFTKRKSASASCTSYLALVSHAACKEQILGQGLPKKEYDRVFGEFERVVEHMSGDSRMLKWSKTCK